VTVKPDAQLTSQSAQVFAVAFASNVTVMVVPVASAPPLIGDVKIAPSTPELAVPGS
jgi:hypothetical protein